MSHRRTAISIIALASLHVSACERSDVSPLKLGLPDATVRTTLAELDDFRELTERVSIAIDGLNRRIVLLDWETGRQATVGREGDGPGEYRTPLRLFPFTGGVALMLDQAGRLFTANANGELVALSRPNVVHRSRSGVRGADSLGRIYVEYERSVIRFEGGRPIWSDSLTIARWDPVSQRVDSIGRIAPSPTSMPVLVNGLTYSTPSQQPLRTRDQWTVSVDGVVAVVHVEPYSVEYLEAEGDRTVGPPILYERTKVTDEMRREWETHSQPFDRYVPTAPWPRFVPPFLEGAMRFDAEGRLWIERTRVPRGAQLYDVVDRRGRLVRRIQFPSGVRVTGFGAGRVYVAGSDSSSLVVLGTYAHLFDR